MKRWHEEYPRTYREWRKHYLCHVESNINSNRVLGGDPYQVDCVCDQQKGLFRKRRALGCGRARCQLCHSYKFPKRLTTRGESCSELKLIEGIEEFIVPGVG
jgi:hypothetical protein